MNNSDQKLNTIVTTVQTLATSVSVLNTMVGVLQKDMKIMQTTVLDLAKQMKEGFSYMRLKFDSIDKRFDALEGRFSGLERRFQLHEESNIEQFKKVHQRIDVFEANTDRRFDNMSVRVEEKMDDRIEGLKTHIGTRIDKVDELSRETAKKVDAIIKPLVHQEVEV